MPSSDNGERNNQNNTKYMSYQDVKKLAEYHNIDINPLVETIKIEGFDEDKFRKIDIFQRINNQELEQYLIKIGYSSMSNKYKDRTCIEYISELMSNVLLEDIIPILFNNFFKDKWRMRKNSKGSDAERIIRKKGNKLNSKSDYLCQKKGEKPFEIEMVTDYTELIKREDYLTFRGYEKIPTTKHKNKWQGLCNSKKHLLVLSLFDKEWKSCLIEPKDYKSHKISPSDRTNIFGKGAVKVYGFKKKLKDCNFLNKKTLTG